MEKIILLFTVLLIHFFSFAQTDKTPYPFLNEKMNGTLYEPLTIKQAYSFCSEFNAINDNLSSVASRSEFKQRLDSIVGEMWPYGQDEWVDFSKRYYLYDSSRLATEYNLLFLDDTQGTWDSLEKIFFEYDENRLMTKSTSKFWISTDSLWKDNHYVTYQYNAQNLMSEYVYTTLNDNTEEWVDLFKFEFIYNTDNLLEIIYQYSGLYEEVEWKLGDSARYFYNADNKLYQVIFYENTGQRNWVPYHQELYSYDDENNLSSMLVQDWDKEKEDWMDDYKEEYESDEYGNITRVYEFDWNKELNTWLNDYMSDYYFDLNYTQNDLLLPPPNLFSFLTLDFMLSEVNMLTQKTEKIFAENEWTNWGQETYYYSLHEIMEVAEQQKDAVHICPNPAREFVKFDFLPTSNSAELNIHNLTGQKVLTEKITNGQQVNISSLKKGLYIYTVTQGDKVFSGKLTIQ